MAIPRQVSLFMVATQFLTRLPVPAIAGFEPVWLTQSARYFPLVGALVGSINVAVWWLCRHALPGTVAVGLMMASSLLVTGAFHEDGFADACDGLGGGVTTEQSLAIMKDSRIGAYGAIGIVMLLGLKWVTLVALPVTEFAAIVVAAHTVSRWCSLGLIWGLRYVRPGPEAKSKPLADSLSGADWILSGLLGAVAILPWALGPVSAADQALLQRMLGAGLVAAMAVALLGALYLRQRLGGYTGDCLGAVQQVAELAFLVVALAASLS